MRVGLIPGVATLGLLALGGKPGALMAQEPRITGGKLELAIPSDELVAVPTAAVDREGNLYLSQRLTRSVRVYSREGRFLREIGRQGRGPGEFESIDRVGFRGDAFFVTDRQLGRVTFFAGDSAWTESWQSPRLEPHFLPDAPVGFFSDGSALVYPAYVPGLIATGELLRVPLLRLHENRDVDEVTSLDVLNSVWGLVSERAGSSTGRQPFADNPLWALAGDGEGIYVVDRRAPDGFDVAFLSPDGELRWRRGYSAPRPEIDEDAVDALVADRATRLSEAFGPRRERARALEAALYVPDHLRAVEAASSGTDGTLWLKMERPPSTVCWWLIGTDGALRGSVALDQRRYQTGLILADAQHLWVRRRDELGLEHVERYRLVAEPGRGDSLC